MRELPCADGRRNVNEAAAADLRLDRPIWKGPCIWYRLQALGEQSWARSATKCQIHLRVRKSGRTVDYG